MDIVTSSFYVLAGHGHEHSHVGNHWPLTEYTIELLLFETYFLILYLKENSWDSCLYLPSSNNY
jgi:hypothetical protein